MQLQHVIINASYFKVSLSLEELIEKEDGHMHTAFGISLDTVVLKHGAVISHTGILVNIGDFVEVESSEVCLYPQLMLVFIYMCM